MESIVNSIIMFICNVFIAFNIVYSQAASYKESITDYTKSKTINGFLLVAFTAFAKVGNLVYRILRRISIFSLKDKNGKDGSDFVKVLDTILVFGISLSMYRLFGVYNNTANVEEFTFIEKVLHCGIYFTHFILTLVYYGFVYGLFGCDNCRIQDSILSRPFNVLQDFGHSITVKETGLSKESVKEALNDEKDSTVNNSIIMSLINYGKSTIGRIISTIAENIASLVSVYVGIKNIWAFLSFAIFGIGYSLIFNFFMKGGIKPSDAEEVVSDAIGNPISIIIDNIKNFLIIMLVVCIIKIISKLVIIVLPKSVQNVIYESSYKLNVKSQESLKKMSDDNFNSDTYAQKYSSELIRAAHKGSGR